MLLKKQRSAPVSAPAPAKKDAKKGSASLAVSTLADRRQHVANVLDSTSDVVDDPRLDGEIVATRCGVGREPACQTSSAFNVYRPAGMAVRLPRRAADDTPVRHSRRAALAADITPNRPLPATSSTASNSRRYETSAPARAVSPQPAASDSLSTTAALSRLVGVIDSLRRSVKDVRTDLDNVQDLVAGLGASDDRHQGSSVTSAIRLLCRSTTYTQLCSYCPSFIHRHRDVVALLDFADAPSVKEHQQ
ncbi:hypothetical protein MMC16_006221 [Acarospora aff. strigata]|nr:hypothetical protein [Acarospora aff. strigata]